MRILLDYRPALRQRTGVGQYAHELAAALQSLLPPSDSLVLFSSSWRDRLPQEAAPGSGRVDARIPVRVLNALWHRLQWPPVEMISGPVDVAHSLHPLLMPTRRAARVVTIHDLDFLDHPERTRAEIRRDYRSLAARHALGADLVVVNSSYTAAGVRARFGLSTERLIVITPGIPSTWPAFDDRVNPARDPGPLLFIGTIEPRKNVAGLLSAYERLLAVRPDAPPLMLAGKQVEQSAAVLEPIARSPLAGRVRYLGYVGDESRYDLYRSASVVVIPSLEEGFGMTALEAMYAGVPVVSSNRGALPEVLGDAATFVDPLDAGEMAQAIARVLSDPGLRLAQVEAGRARAAQYSWRVSARRLLDAYHGVLSRHAA